MATKGTVRVELSKDNTQALYARRLTDDNEVKQALLHAQLLDALGRCSPTIDQLGMTAMRELLDSIPTVVTYFQTHSEYVWVIGVYYTRHGETVGPAVAVVAAAAGAAALGISPSSSSSSSNLASPSSTTTVHADIEDAGSAEPMAACPSSIINVDHERDENSTLVAVLTVYPDVDGLFIGSTTLNTQWVKNIAYQSLLHKVLAAVKKLFFKTNQDPRPLVELPLNRMYLLDLYHIENRAEFRRQRQLMQAMVDRLGRDSVDEEDEKAAGEEGNTYRPYMPFKPVTNMPLLSACTSSESVTAHLERVLHAAHLHDEALPGGAAAVETDNLSASSSLSAASESSLSSGSAASSDRSSLVAHDSTNYVEPVYYTRETLAAAAAAAVAAVAAVSSSTPSDPPLPSLVPLSPRSPALQRRGGVFQPCAPRTTSVQHDPQHLPPHMQRRIMVGTMTRSSAATQAPTRAQAIVEPLTGSLRRMIRSPRSPRGEGTATSGFASLRRATAARDNPTDSVDNPLIN